MGKVFGEEQGSSVPGRRLAAGGSQEGGAGEGILARKLLPFPAAFHRRFLVQAKITACWSLRASLLPGIPPSPQKTSTKCQQHPHQLLEAPFPPYAEVAQSALG